MKMVKALLLGATAGLVSVAGAQAADLPGKAAPASYVKICDTYGAGYYYIPGSTTCLKIGGMLRMHVLAGQSYVGNQDYVQFHQRLTVNFDARSQTEYGLLRGYGEIIARRGATASGYMNLGATTIADQTLVNLNAAFIQFGPLTAGFAPSFFNFMAGGGIVDGQSAGLNPSTSPNTLIAYTAGFGGGVAATLSIEDRNLREVGAQYALAASTAGGASTQAIAHPLAQAITSGRVFYAAQQMPDIVAAVRVEQGWGAVQIMGALHQINAWNVTAATTSATLGATGPTLSTLGWAVGAGVRLNLDQFARGDNFWFQGVVSNGAINYVFNGVNTADNLPSNNLSAAGTNGLGLAYADAAYAPADISGSGLAKTTAYGLFGSFQHFFTPAVRSQLFANYVNVDAAGGTLNDFDFFSVGLYTIYSPVRDIDLGLEFGYRNVNSYSAVGVPSAIPNYNSWFANARIERRF